MPKQKPKKWKVSVKRAIKAVQDNDGFVATAAQNLGISHTTLYLMLEHEPKLAQALEAVRERTKDFVESKLMVAIEQGKTAEILFFLKTQVRDRGYIENPITQSQTKIIIKGYSVADVTPDEL